MDYRVANLKYMTADELDALIRDAEAERERRKVKPCVRRMEVDGEYFRVDGLSVATIRPGGCYSLNIDHATAKRQIALAFCWADWGARANQHGLARIEVGTPLHYEFCWLVREILDMESSSESTEAARAAGWIK